MLRERVSWIIKNGWNLFSVVGVVGTFYFAIVYVPDYVKDISDGKVSVARESLASDVQEVLFYNKSLEVLDVNALIKAREIKLGFKYPYTAQDLLLEVQDRFVSNKFIPLDRRQELVSTINAILSRSPVEPVRPPAGFDWYTFISYMISVLVALAAALGWKSLINKIQVDRETVVDLACGEVFTNETTIAPLVETKKYESLIAEILNELSVEFTQNAFPDRGHDFTIPGVSPPILIEVKAYKQLMGLGTVREICAGLTRSGWDGILIVASGLTKNAARYIDQFNLMREEKIHIVTGRDKDTVKGQLAQILKL